jgi:hypothetical protein
MNNEIIKKAIESVFEDLLNMNEKEFKKEFEKHKSGDIAEILLEIGARSIVDFENDNSRI